MQAPNSSLLRSLPLVSTGSKNSETISFSLVPGYPTQSVGERFAIRPVFRRGRWQEEGACHCDWRGSREFSPAIGVTPLVFDDSRKHQQPGADLQLHSRSRVQVDLEAHLFLL